MSTYANIKLGEIFAMYGNPFSRGNCKKNIKQKLRTKNFKRVDFQKFVEIKSELKYSGTYKNTMYPRKFRKLLLSGLITENKNSNKIKNNLILSKNEDKEFFKLCNNEMINKITSYNNTQFTCPNTINNSNKLIKNFGDNNKFAIEEECEKEILDLEKEVPFININNIKNSMNITKEYNEDQQSQIDISSPIISIPIERTNKSNQIKKNKNNLAKEYGDDNKKNFFKKNISIDSNKKNN